MSEEQILEQSASKDKRRKIERACDACRRRKIRCDGFIGEGSKCARCIRMNLVCTDSAPKRQRGPAKGYVRNLEARLGRIEAMLQQLNPKPSVLTEAGLFDDEAVENGSSEEEPQVSPGAVTEDRNTSISGFPLLPTSFQSTYDDEAFSTDEEDAMGYTETQKIVRQMQELDISGRSGGYQGKSSQANLVKSVLQTREKYLTEHGSSSVLPPNQIFSQRRPEMWTAVPWEPLEHSGYFLTTPGHHFEFPESDLLSELIDNYFRQTNSFLPILNEVLLQRQLADGLHLVHHGLGAVVLLVASLGSRASHDPRVYADPTDTRSGGWKWFSQVQQLRRSLTASGTLYDLQIILLTVQFLHASSAPESGWFLLGTGIRLATDAGAHRRRFYGPKPTANGELWKRAFWALICLDRHISHVLGRPCAMHDEDFDLELPVECDDEYWFDSDPNLAFKQPSGKPSSNSYFIQGIKYFQVVSFVLRTIYTVNKSKIILGLVGDDWQQRIVAQCDSALNDWKNNIPEHLVWDPHRGDDKFCHPSAILHIFYYLLQISIHRPFIPSPRRPSLASFPSLEICTNAARSIISVLRSLDQRAKDPMAPEIVAAFTAGVVLLLHVWGSKHRDASLDFQEETEDINACLRRLKACQKAWHIAGRHWNTLYDLAISTKLPLTEKRSDEQQHITDQTQIQPPTTLDLTYSSRSQNTTPQIPISQGQFDGSSNIPNVTLPFDYAFSPDSTNSTPEISRMAVHNPALAVPYPSALLLDASWSEISVDQLDPPSTSAAQWNTYIMPPTPSNTESIGVQSYELPRDVDGILSISLDVDNSGVYDPAFLWSRAPITFELDDWNTYINDFTQTIPSQAIAGRLKTRLGTA